MRARTLRVLMGKGQHAPEDRRRLKEALAIVVPETAELSDDCCHL